MIDSARPLTAGDEVHCSNCGGWHATYLKHSGDPHPYSQNMLFFDCPESGGPFFAGTVGKAAQNRRSRSATQNR